MVLPSEVLTPVTSLIKRKLISLLYHTDNYFMFKIKYQNSEASGPECYGKIKKILADIVRKW